MSTSDSWNANRHTARCTSLALCPWSHSVNRCLDEGNGDQCHTVGLHMTRERLYDCLPLRSCGGVKWRYRSLSSSMLITFSSSFEQTTVTMRETTGERDTSTDTETGIYTWTDKQLVCVTYTCHIASSLLQHVLKMSCRLTE